MATSTKGEIRFDDAVPAVASAVAAADGAILDQCLFLRMADGKVTVIVPDNVLTQEQIRVVASSIVARGGKYVEPHSACLTPSDLFEEDIFQSESIGLEFADVNGKSTVVRVLDRRIVAQDWSRIRFDPIAGVPPLLSFYSCKGGVGRSTSVAVCAAGLADKGYNVLVIDLDIEAPGLGSILLEPADLPEFGAVDYLVENGISGTGESFVRECIAPSSLVVGRSGSVDVLPASGQRSANNPHNLIAKLGRALLDDASGPLVEQIRKLVGEACATKKYDVVLVDVRAGLSESSAAALLSTGGYMLLFGIDNPQTFESYTYLFAHFARFSPPTSWRSRLQMVQAKVSSLESAQHFRERSSDLFASYVYDEAMPDTEVVDVFNFDIEDDLAPHFAWTVEFDANFQDFDPHTRQDQLSRSKFERAFGQFVARVESLVAEGH